MMLGAIALGEVNLEWLQGLPRTLRRLVVMQEPQGTEFQTYVDSYLVTARRLGFGGARRLSMIICSQLDELCIVTDGDGQYPTDSIAKFASVLSTTEEEVLIAQRTNRALWMKAGAEIVDRREFEKFENRCALRYLNRSDLPVDMDMQPGLFGFKSGIVEKILPADSGWLADWEITLNAVTKTKFGLVNLETNSRVQEKSTMTFDDQEEKFRRLRKLAGVSLMDVFREHERMLKPKEAEIILALISRVERTPHG
jgi:hypothetical protein